LTAFQAMAAEAHALGKPVAALKVGASEQAQAGTVSHTASLAGSDAGARALLARLGIGQVGSLAAMLQALTLLHVAGPLGSNRIGSMSCSGGEASLIADMAHAGGLVCPPLDAGQRAALRAVLGPEVALANPLDYHTRIWGDVDAMAATFAAVMQADLALGCVVLDFPRGDRCSAAAWAPVIEAVDRARRAAAGPMAILASLPETLPETTAERLIERGIVPLAGMAEGVEAIRVAARIGIWQPEAAPVLVPAEGAPAPTLGEAAAKAALAAFGLHLPRAAVAEGPSGAAAAAARIGCPVVLKGEGFAHKTEAGAVALNLATPGAVQAAAAAMPTTRFLVEEMVRDTVVELLVGVVRDPAHGYVLTLAAGGTLTEVLADRAALLVPASRPAVHAALAGLWVYRLLTGYRGRPAADLEAIVDAVMALQAYVAAAHPHEVEINPLMCGPAGAVAADALIRPADAGAQHTAALADA
ncbi:MAG: acetate--CoA ligase family protein, partial [Pseudomonadota bacterium]